jgi:hypothetical protein
MTSVVEDLLGEMCRASLEIDATYRLQEGENEISPKILSLPSAGFEGPEQSAEERPEAGEEHLGRQWDILFCSTDQDLQQPIFGADSNGGRAQEGGGLGQGGEVLPGYSGLQQAQKGRATPLHRPEDREMLVLVDLP